MRMRRAVIIVSASRFGAVEASAREHTPDRREPPRSRCAFPSQGGMVPRHLGNRLSYSAAPMLGDQQPSHSDTDAAIAVPDQVAEASKEPRRCAWCGAPLASFAGPLSGRKRCEACGAATTAPWPTNEDLARAYATYRPESGRFSGMGDTVLRWTRGRLARRLDRLAPPGPILDVGAGDGTLIDALAARGRDATGLERDSRHPRVREADVTDVEGSWAAVVFWHSLEHLRSPGRAIDHAAEHLRPGGLLVVALPNTSSLQARVFGDRWFHLDLPRHLVHLSADTLTERLGSLGLTVSKVSHWRGGQAVFGWLHGFVGTLPGRPDLYDAIRRPEARTCAMPARTRAVALGTAVLLVVPATMAAAVEVLARRGATVSVEAQRA